MRASPCQRLNSAKLQGSPSALVTSGVNGILKRKVVSPQWDRSARSSRRQHRRCIGCEKRPCFLPLSIWAVFAASSILSSGHPFARLKSQFLPYERRTNTDRHAKVRRFVCHTCANPLQRTSGNSRAAAPLGEQSLLRRVASQFGIRCASNDRSWSRLLQIIAQAERAARQYTSRISRTERGTCTKRRRQNLVEQVGCTWRTKVTLWPPGRGCWRH